MSTIPLRIDSELVNRARETGGVMERTPTAQIEFWAKLGRVMEGVMSHTGVVALKQAAQVNKLDELLNLSTSPAGKERALAEIRRHKGPTYSSDPEEAGVIIERAADGTQRRGRFVSRRFTPFAGAMVK
jgi:ParD-like antitoxin of type II bacterial toxin-antitoxin system